jgi:hypothetical protein
MLRSPARDSPVTQCNVELIYTSVLGIEVVPTERLRRYWAVLNLLLVLLWNGDFLQIARLDQRVITKLDKDVIRFDVY